MLKGNNITQSNEGRQNESSVQGFLCEHYSQKRKLIHINWKLIFQSNIPISSQSRLRPKDVGVFHVSSFYGFPPNSDFFSLSRIKQCCAKAQPFNSGCLFLCLRALCL